MSYAVKSIFDTIQGEGGRAGTRAVFVRFAGCNLWDGHPEHRARGQGACARWCDTDFFRGQKMTAEEIEARASTLWPLGPEARWLVLTGGEPLLQVDEALVDYLHAAGWHIAVETNGTQAPAWATKIDWLTVSPKLGGEIVLRQGHELKVVLPGAIGGEPGWGDEALLALAAQGFYSTKFVQPMDPPLSTSVEDTLLHPRIGGAPGHLAVTAADQHQANLARCLEFVRANPTWRLGAQLHKHWHLP